jgi:putative ABC transport system permease protein
MNGGAAAGIAAPPQGVASRKEGTGLPRSRPIGPIDSVRIALGGLASRPLRAVLTALGIAIGIAAMIAVVGISDASRGSLLSVLDRLGTNLLEVTPGEAMFSGTQAALPADARAMLQRIPPVQGATSVAVLPSIVRRTDRVSVQESGGITLLAAESSLLSTLDGQVRLGRSLDAATGSYPTVVLGSVAAERLGVVDLDRSTMIWIANQWFTVVGVLEPMALNPEIDRSAIVGYEAAKAYLDFDGAASTIYVRVHPDSLAAIRTILAATANPQHPEEVRVSRPSDAIEAKAAAATTFTGLLLGLGAVALLVGGLGVANVMLMAVLERRTEIGLRRALGATRGHIARQFLTEALVLAGLGGLAGVALGCAIVVGYAQSQGWPSSVPVVAVAAGLVGSLAIGAVSGLYPALRAAALPPTEALRSE